MSSCFYLLSESVWPILVSMGMMGMVGSGILSFLNQGVNWFLVSFVVVFILCLFWWMDFNFEVYSKGEQGKSLCSSIRIGMVFFIMSEVMFFISAFWGFFHSQGILALSSGFIWPPEYSSQINPFSIPILNSVVLLSSGSTVTLCHHFIMMGSFSKACSYLDVTIALGILFSFLQAYEYNDSIIDMTSGCYGSTFFFLTGFHGFHVMVGIWFLYMMLQRMLFCKYSSTFYLGMEVASWYWHFVDVVWLFLFSFVYFN